MCARKIALLQLAARRCRRRARTRRSRPRRAPAPPRDARRRGRRRARRRRARARSADGSPSAHRTPRRVPRRQRSDAARPTSAAGSPAPGSPGRPPPPRARPPRRGRRRTRRRRGGSGCRSRERAMRSVGSPRGGPWSRLRLGRWMAWLDTSESIVAHWLRAAREALLGEMPILAGGTALFAIFAVVPTLAAAVAIYGLVADPHADRLAPRAASQSVLPPQVVRVRRRSARAPGAAARARELGSRWRSASSSRCSSARGAARALIDSLNRAYRVRERRSPLHKLAGHARDGASARCVGLLLMFGVVVALPGDLRAARTSATTPIVELAALAGPDGRHVLHAARALSLRAVAAAARHRAPPVARRADRDRAARARVVGAVACGSTASPTTTCSTARSAAWSSCCCGSTCRRWRSCVGGFVNAELERHAGAPAPDRSMY